MSFFSHADSSSDWSARGGPAHSGGKREGDDSQAPRRTLPSGRTSPAQQIQLILALAELGADGKEVGRAAVAARTGRSLDTVSDCMGFLAEVGLAEPGRGRYELTDQGRVFAEVWQRDSAQARLLLHPLMRAHWSTAAVAHHLAGGALPQEELARLLRAGLRGMPMRGVYLVEWLVIGLVVERDDRLHIHLPGQAPPHSGPHSAPQAEEPEPEAEDPDPAFLFGLTLREIQELPDARYIAFMEGVLQTLRGAHSPAA
ncbi:hypothetical protein [Streptomyces sp. AP-93]|uniref:hypothetical protein n=1 Tax=Streptomyces sp. AP-93 TaxID=2929048 RepID=UPI001FAE85FC|nr:hypothetical protein [Streptomyces sp. AP-93]MCJ0871188.1 hypothetical protein [Streptomyces sp. AP-93]